MRKPPFPKERQRSGFEGENMVGVEGGTGQRGGRGNCRGNAIYERRMNKKLFQDLP